MEAACLKCFMSCAVFSTALVGSPVQATPVISELFYDAIGGDAGLVFVELFGLPGESLDGLVLEGVNGSTGSVYSSFTLSGVIPDDGVFVIGDNSMDFSVLATPTPGTVPFPGAVPLPASAWLLGSGLMTLVSLRRRR